MDSKIIKYFKDHGYYPFAQVESWVSELLFRSCQHSIVAKYDTKEGEKDCTVQFVMFNDIGKYVVICIDEKIKIKWCYSFVDFEFATEFYHNHFNFRSLYHKHIGG